MLSDDREREGCLLKGLWSLFSDGLAVLSQGFQPKFCSFLDVGSISS
jgi:hypothetical protein